LAKKISKGEDLDFTYILGLDPELEEWRAMAAEWIKGQRRSQTAKKQALDKFLGEFIHGLGLPKFPSEFLSVAYEPPSFYDHLQIMKKTQPTNYVVDFLDWVLVNHFSAEDDNSRKTIAPGFHNPFDKKKRGKGYAESNKRALPHRYVKELREIICPPDARSFSDWTWAIENSFFGSRSGNGDWFEVDPALIDEDDPDCIWRKRSVPIRAYQVDNNSSSTRVVGEREVFELWSPARWVALYIKLELPLRTAQVRWLDSGEADTWRYQGGLWLNNPSKLARGTAKRPYQKGVFRRAPDPDTGEDKTALYINTNKTADTDKAEDAKGYVVPWAHPRALPWLERLRDWQAKYNPVAAPIPWTSLKKKHLSQIKHPEILEEMGEACFLFRAAYAKQQTDHDKPLADGDIQKAWRRLLGELEKRVAARNDGKRKKLIFVMPGSDKGTEFPLHSLRVSLITAYAIDGGVPIAILSKCVAGHARIIMTLYYTKAGIGRVTEVMDEAERKMAAKEKESFETFLADATYKQIEQAAAFNDPAAIQVIMDSRSRAGWVVDDKGICPLGCSACDKGYKLLRQGKEKEEVAPVPGFPNEKNCVRCRFFLSGPAFLPGLQDHFNYTMSQLSDASERYRNLEQQVEELQDEMMACTESGAPFTKLAEFERLHRHYEAMADKCNKLGDDVNATVRLVKRSIEILLNPAAAEDDNLSLVTVGSMQDVQFAFAEVSETHQIEVLCENATFYPEADASKAVLRRSQILDACLEMNGRAPAFFKLSPELQHQVGNEFMRLLKVRQGSIKGAVDVVEGMQSLEDIGLLEQATDLIEHSTGQSLLPNSTIHAMQLPTGTGGD
jgi:Putative integrase